MSARTPDLPVMVTVLPEELIALGSPPALPRCCLGCYRYGSVQAIWRGLAALYDPPERGSRKAADR